MKHITFLGKTTDIFSCDEYQAKSGNHFHEHMVVSVDTSTMNGNTERFIQELIMKHVMEVVRPVGIQSMIDMGLMKHMHDYNDLVCLALVIIPHR